MSYSAHIYRLDDGRLRLTFLQISEESGATFLSELGDFTREWITNWLTDRVHPNENVDHLLVPLEAEAEVTVPVGHMMAQMRMEGGCLVKSQATVEDVCVWLGEYQRLYFDDRKITVVVSTSGNDDLKGTACFGATGPSSGSVFLSSELLLFPSALKIALVHELIHANLHATGKTDQDDDHGPAFKAERRRLMDSGVYEPLL